MPITQLPLMKGLGKSYIDADYIDRVPVNMLATPKEVLGANGYLRSFPGIAPDRVVNGVSRGAIYNTAQSSVYRVMGNKLYLAGSEVGDVSGSGRVGMAFSYNSQAVNAGGYVTMYRYDGTVARLENWPDGDNAQYDVGIVRDICRNRSRYIWSKEGTDTFGITDLEDESHPDRYRPFYRAESQPDGILGLAPWRDYVVCFGSNTIEYFALTGSSDATQPVYVAQPSLMVQKGIAGTYAKCAFAGSFAFISNHSTGAPSVYIVDSGRTTPIATASIEKILREYLAEELAEAFLETLRFDAHELLIIHLSRHVLCYDASASTGGPQWCVLTSGLDGGIYSGVDFIFEGNQVTLGDKFESNKGTLNFEVSSQYNRLSEHVLYTPLFKVDNARVFDFELESSTGVAQYANTLFISASVDGINYGKEQSISHEVPLVYNRRALWRRIGRIRKNIGFKVRIVTSSPVTLSNCQVRVE